MVFTRIRRISTWIRDRLQKIPNSVLNPVSILSVTMAGWFVLGAWALWSWRIDLLNPNPAIAALLLAGVCLVLAFIAALLHQHSTENARKTAEFKNLRAQRQDQEQRIQSLRVQNHSLFEQIERLETELASSFHGPHATPPPLTGLHHLIQSTQPLDVWKDESQKLDQHTHILLSVILLSGGDITNVHLLKRLWGSRSGRCVLLAQFGNARPLALKLGSVQSLEREQQRYRHCVGQRLGMTPGAPAIPRQVYGWIDGQEWGAMTYNLIGAEDDEMGQIRTLSEYCIDHSGQFLQIERGLTKVFMALRSWWDEPTWTEACGHSRRSSLFHEYDRLRRRLDEMRSGFAAAADGLLAETPLPMDPTGAWWEVGGHRLPNPLQWVHEHFTSGGMGDWVERPALRRDSIIHGDLHGGNILITGQEEALHAWLIDFPHTHVGPTVHDLARLEVDLKYTLCDDDLYDWLGLDRIVDIETTLTPDSSEDSPSLAALTPGKLSPLSTSAESRAKAQTFQRIGELIRDEARRYMIGNDARPYYLALLHATLPTLYYRDRTPRQKVHAAIAAGLLCKRLGDQSSTSVDPFHS